MRWLAFLLGVLFTAGPLLGEARGAANIRIGGRGILDVSPFQRGKGGGAVRLADCSGITIEGIVIRDPDVWCCSLFGCREATISNIKLIGLWRYNADGIDLCNTQHATVRDRFIRSFDDSIVLKGLKNPFDNRPLGNLRIRGCVIWNDWGRALEIGAETCAPEISDVVFEDCDIIRTTHVAIDIQHGDRAVRQECPTGTLTQAVTVVHKVSLGTTEFSGFGNVGVRPYWIQLHLSRGCQHRQYGQPAGEKDDRQEKKRFAGARRVRRDFAGRRALPMTVGRALFLTAAHRGVASRVSIASSWTAPLRSQVGCVQRTT